GSYNASGPSYSGIYSGEGICCALILIVSGIFLIRRSAIAYWCAITSLIFAVIFISRMLSMHSSISGPGISASAGLEADAGFFLCCSVRFLCFCLYYYQY